MQCLLPCAAVQTAAVLTKPSVIISSAATEKKGEAKLVVDGKAATCMQTKSSTDAAVGAWLTLDLSTVVSARTVVLTNRWAPVDRFAQAAQQCIEAWSLKSVELPWPVQACVGLSFS